MSLMPKSLIFLSETEQLLQRNVVSISEERKMVAEIARLKAAIPMIE